MNLPDFAFPRHEAEESRKDLEKALKSHNYEKALRALINLNIAESIISKENNFEFLRSIDSIIVKLPAPYNGVGYILEAQIYLNLYQADRYTYDNRKVVSEMADSNPEFWDKTLYFNKINSLCSKALECKDKAVSTPLARLASILTDSDFFARYPFTVYDFIVYNVLKFHKTTEQSDIIPFFITPSESESALSIDLLNQLIEIHQDNPLPLIYAQLKKADYVDPTDKNKFLWEEIQRLKTAPEVAILVSELYRSIEFKSDTEDSIDEVKQAKYQISEEEFLSLAKTLKEKFPNSQYTQYLDPIICNLTLPVISLEYPNIVEVNTDFQVKVTSLNLDKFYILLLSAEKLESKSYSNRNLAVRTKLIEAKEIKLESASLNQVDSIHIFKVLQPGKYILIPSKSKNTIDIINRNDSYFPRFLTASDIDLLPLYSSFDTDTTDAIKTRNLNGVYVVNSADGSPVQGAKVTFTKNTYSRLDGDQNKTETVFSDKNGFAESSMQGVNINAEFKGSKSEANLYEGWSSKNSPRFNLRIFTDRQIYRPGDTVNFLGVYYYAETNKAEIIQNQPIKVELRDANHQKRDSITLKSDSSGRIFGEFKIPEEGLLGSWCISSEYGSQYFQVAEYKTPSFFLTLQQTESTPEKIEFKGVASTYSGMPLADCEIQFDVTYSPLFFFYHSASSRQTYSSGVVTNSEGEFSISLPLGNLDADKYKGIFRIKTTATDAAGETITSPSLNFWISDYYNISPSIPNKLKIEEDSLDLKIYVYDMAQYPVVKKLCYKIYNEAKEEVRMGVFESPLLKVSTADLPSGRYTFEFSLIDEKRGRATVTSVLFRDTDSVPPVESLIWIPEERIVVSSSENTARIAYGCSYEGQNMLCIISNPSGLSDLFWLESDGKMGYIDIPSPSQDTRTFVSFLAYRNHRFESINVEVIPKIQLENLEITTTTFRNKLEPEQLETWKFNFSTASRPTPSFAYALLYDKSLDALANLNWNINLFSPSYPYRINYSSMSSSRVANTFYPYACHSNYYHFPLIDFETYGHPLGGVYGYFMERPMMKRAATTGFGIAANDSGVIDSFDASALNMSEYRTIAEESAIETGDAVSEESQEVREIEMPVGFFKPDLNSDADGNLEIEFTVPNFNTTWNFIMGAYTPDCQSAFIKLECVASKKVMVKMLSPRFLRTGDKAVITATLFNNSEETRDIYGEFEIFDPLSNKIIKRVITDSQSIRPSGSQVISIDYDCPDNINNIGLRAFAKSKGYSDGEQTVIPVLPASQPIIESETFYLRPGQIKADLPLPEFKENAAVTFTYCDNPLWEVLTSLPPLIQPYSESLTSKVYAFYANSVGYGLLKTNPSLYKGLDKIVKGEAGDSLLVSNLAKNQELKTITLNNTPWVNNALSENLRLSRLSNLLDKEGAVRDISALWNSISLMQNHDGGWSWCPGMRSSLWATEIVLINSGLIIKGGYMPKDIDPSKALNNGINYCESTYTEEYYKVKNDFSFFYESMQQYLFIRSFFPEYKSSGNFIRIKKKALDYLENNWKKLSIFQKATAAITLWRENRTETAGIILESLRQYASEDSLKGAWFDNLDSFYGGGGKMLTTARVLTAFNEIQPSDPIIDKLRQWILIQKQAQDFQEGLFSVDVIDATLNSGTPWDGDYPLPEIIIAGKKVEPDQIAKLTGQCKFNVNVSTTKGKGKNIEIYRFSPTPAWGGIVSQFIQPMQDVKAAAISDLSIEKQMWKIISGEDGEHAIKTDSFTVGDKVRISLIVDCGRDMDYVALTDERPACFEPANQISGYGVIDGLWCYHETRNNSTNLFFEFLPKGRHIISYEGYMMEGGDFSSGVAHLQCQYAPELIAHSGGEFLHITVKNK